MIAIIDYGAGNLFSVKNALDYIGEKAIITNEKADILSADRLILPGVGAFPKAMQMLNDSDLADTIKSCAIINKKPFLGICLGMQMLFDYSMEFEKVSGLGMIDGYIDRIETNFKVPHMGYNELELNEQSELLDSVNQGDYVYFVHSYMANTASINISAYCDYGVKIPALVKKDNIFGAQFHPEKSGEVGLKMLKNFATY